MTNSPKETYRHLVYQIILISSVVIFSYANALKNKFVFDDNSLVVENWMLDGWHNIPRLLTSGYWSSTGHSGGLYRPIPMISFLLERSIGGLNPLVYHLDNILLHFFCCLLIFLILRKLTSDRKLAFLAVLLFAAHPVHVEAVAWVSGRAELLWSFFFLSSFYLYITSKSVKGLLASGFLFLLALFSKESAAVLPLILLSYTIFFEREAGPFPWRKSIVRLSPFIAALCIYIPARAIVLEGYVVPTGIYSSLGNLTLINRFLTMSEALFHYIRISFLPFGLTADYMFPAPSIFDYRVLVAIATVALGALFITKSIIRGLLAFAVVWFFVTLAPVSNIFPTGIIMSERALYIPVLGPCIVLASAFSRTLNINRFRLAAGFAAAFIIGLLSINTVFRNPLWRDQGVFELHQAQYMKHRTELFPNVWLYHASLAYLYISQNNFGPDTGHAVAEVLRLDPDNFDGHYLMAELLVHKGEYSDALSEAEKAIRLNPAIGQTYSLAGGILHSMGRDREALRMVEKAINLEPDNSDHYLNKGYILASLGMKNRAIAAFEQTARLTPQDPEPFFQLGALYGSLGEYNKAVSNLKKASDLSPDNPLVHYLLGLSYKNLNDPSRAISELNQAVALEPGYADALKALNELHN